MAAPILLPETPVARAVNWSGVPRLGGTLGEFSGGAQQVQDWGDFPLTCEVQMPAMSQARAAAWIAALLDARGGKVLFLDPFYRAPLGTALGSPVVLGDHTTATLSLATAGWDSLAQALMPADRMQICRNYLTFPRAFDNAAWTKNQCSVSANSQTAPDGSATADRITPSGGATDAYVAQAPLVDDLAGRKVKAAVWLKAPVPASLALTLQNQSAANRATQAINVTTSWQRSLVEATMQSGDTQAKFLIGGDASWVAADGAIDVWMASLWSEELDGRLHFNLRQADADSNGKATLRIFPETRIVIPDGSVIVTTNPKGEFRMLAPRTWTADIVSQFGMQFTLMEAY